MDSITNLQLIHYDISNHITLMKRSIEEVNAPVQQVVNTEESPEKKQKMQTPYQELCDLLTSKGPPQDQEPDFEEYWDEYDYDDNLEKEITKLLRCLEFRPGQWLEEYKELFTIALDVCIYVEFFEALRNFVDVEFNSVVDLDSKFPVEVRKEIFDLLIHHPKRCYYIQTIWSVESVLKTDEDYAKYLQLCYKNDDYKCWAHILSRYRSNMVNRHELIHTDQKKWFEKAACDNSSSKFFEHLYQICYSNDVFPMQDFAFVLAKGTVEKVRFVIEHDIEHKKIFKYQVLPCTVRSVPFGNQHGIVQCSHYYSHYYVLIPGCIRSHDFESDNEIDSDKESFIKSGMVVAVPKDTYYYIMDHQEVK